MTYTHTGKLPVGATKGHTVAVQGVQKEKGLAGVMECCQLLQVECHTSECRQLL